MTSWNTHSYKNIEFEQNFYIYRSHCLLDHNLGIMKI